MKRIVSISIGSSKRDHCVEVELLGEKFSIERIGTDGSIKKAIALIEELDGKVAALGMGGIDLYLWAGENRYIIREALALKKAARLTPIVDGSGLKNSLEPRVIHHLDEEGIINFREKITLITCALDRFGMAQAIDAYKGKLILGDLLFGLGMDLPISSLQRIQKIAQWVAPIICRLPFRMLYPTGNKQNKNTRSKVTKYYDIADIIAGDFHYIKRYMPQSMRGKIVITNTITKEDVLELKKRGTYLLVTTTPQLGERSFGTNVMEAMMVAMIQERKYRTYEEVIEATNFKPRIEYLQPQSNV